ncbi:hypothetical protein RFI_05064, partial [Reticulomyxa filosa]
GRKEEKGRAGTEGGGRGAGGTGGAGGGGGGGGKGGLNEMCTQFACSPRQFVCVTPHALYRFEYLRPIDELRRCVVAKDKKGIECLFNKYSTEECLVMLFHLTAMNNKFHIDSNEFSSAVYYFARAHIYKRKEEHTSHVWYNQSWYSTTRLFGDVKVFALYLCLARVLRAFLPFACVVVEESTGRVQPRWTINQIKVPLAFMCNLKRFTEANLKEWTTPTTWFDEKGRNSSGSSGSSGSSSRGGGISQQSLYRDLDKFLQGLEWCIETFHMLLHLCTPAYLEKILRILSPNDYLMFKSFALVDTMIVHSGEEHERQWKCILRALVAAIGNDEQVERLHHVAPHLFPEPDLLVFKADSLLRTRDTTIPVAMEANTNKALSLLKQASFNRGFDLQTSCWALRDIFPEMTVERLTQCYDEIISSVNVLFATENSVPNRVSQAQKVLHECLASNDRTLIHKLYTWFFEHNLIHILFPLKAPGLEAFLKGGVEGREGAEEEEEERGGGGGGGGGGRGEESTAATATATATATAAEEQALIEALPYRVERWKQLLKWYLFSKQYAKYGNLVRYICTQVVGIPLRDRQQLLWDGAMAIKAADDRLMTEFSTGRELHLTYNFEFLHSACDIQARVLSALERASPSSEEELPEIVASWKQLCKVLNDKLLDLSKVRNVAIRYRIWDAALDCVALEGNPRCQSSAEKIWAEWISDLFHQTTAPLRRVGAHESAWVEQVSNELKWWCDRHDIVKQPWMFPIKFLVKCLEQKVIASNIDDQSKNRAVVDIMQYCGVSWSSLLDAYANVVGDSSLPVTTIVHVLFSIAHLLNIADDVHSIAKRQELARKMVQFINSLNVHQNIKRKLLQSFHPHINHNTYR